MFNLMKGCEYMAATQTDAVSLLKAWFNKATNWQKDLFCQIWQGNEDVEKLTARAFSLAKAEYLGESSKFAPLTTFPTTVEVTINALNKEGAYLDIEKNKTNQVSSVKM